jgi:hypothetical protein
MDTNTTVAIINLGLGLPSLLMSLYILPLQLSQMKHYKTVVPYRWVLLAINLAAMSAALASLWATVELVVMGHYSDLLRITSSILVRIFFLVVVVGLFLMHTVFNKRHP